ncbi:hypothetical protein [Acinetobacter lwoffii]|uniref:hypothetical protein n=1 Tax=Acinetobacter lwoffii TaxID=28090 RepID=UPI002DBFA9C6|nr:hypothetical protein [Acinetobacter lwoffii]MEB6680293.1 phage tail protein [Acinetobacter lwoffii]
MGKSSSQVVGYRHYAKFAAFIGNRIEKLIGINFDNRKWVIHDPLKHPPNLLPVLEGNLFGENEGGVSGNVDIHFGYPNQGPNTEYQKYFPLVSGYPYQSYLVFRSLTGGAPSLGEGLSPAGFYLGNSGYMKEMLLWVKRTRVRNDGRGQWYEVRGDGAVVCEISAAIFDGGVSPEHASSFKYRKYVKIWSSIFGNEASESISEEYTFIGTNSSDVENLTMSGSKSAFTSLDLNAINNSSGYWVNEIMPIKNGMFSWVQVERKTVAQKSAMTFTREAPLAIRNYKKINLEYGYTEVFECLVNLSLGFGVRVEGFGGVVYSTPKNSEFAELSNVSFFNFIELEIKFDPFQSQALDINPIHKIREILTDNTAMGKPESDVNDVNFMKAADRIYDEGLGISWAIDEKSCIEAIEELCYHIEAGIRVNRQTGLYEMILFRDDWFAEDEIHDITESKIKDLTLEVMNSDDIVNQLNVTYYDRQRIKNSTFSIYENGSILTMGHANAESVEFPYFMNMRNAEIVANWKLKQFSTPAWSGSFTTGWKEARKWNRYDLIRLPWSRKWESTILVRIMKINLGNGVDNTVSIDFEEVVPYSGEMNTSIVVDESMNAGVQSPQPNINAVFEAPYYLTVLRAGQTNTDLELSNNPDIGYVAAIAAKPQNNSLNALLYTDGGVDEFEQVSRLDYCDILQLDQPIIETTSSFTVAGSLTQVANSNNLILLNDELMGFVSFDNETKVLTVKRGVLDTVPKKHSTGSLFVFDFPDVAFDSTQYAQSEVVEAQVLTTTPSGVQELTVGTEVEIQARAIRPYPPSNVKINGIYFPETMLVASDLTVTWSHRNRVQQTGGDAIGWFENSVTLEAGVTYSIELSTVDGVLLAADSIASDNYTVPEATIIPNKAHKLKLWSVRDGIYSYQIFEHNFFVEAASLILTATATKSNVSGNTIPAANITVDVGTSLKANMQFDGSSIRGKAEPGATITIEIED